MTQKIALLGATGSIGDSVLRVIQENPGLYELFAVSAHRNTERLWAICEQFKPALVIVSTPEQAQYLSAQLAYPVVVLLGAQGLCEAATHPEVTTVVAAITGVAGLPSTMAAAQAGKKILLANKESLVVAGYLLMETLKKSGSILLPVDSEHNAIFQVMPPHFELGVCPADVEKILLTASGGPFWQWTTEQMREATPLAACQHPTWKMGDKISVDSATMVNKGLELIEACWLFGLNPAQIEVLIHPQSVVHSMVEMADGSILAQLGPSDMRVPIAHCLGWPHRIRSGAARLKCTDFTAWTFFEPDRQRFPAIEGAKAAFMASGFMPCIYNAANEVAVASFLDHRLGFLDIYPLIDTLLSQDWRAEYDERSVTLEALLHLDRRVRTVALECIGAD